MKLSEIERAIGRLLALYGDVELDDCGEHIQTYVDEYLIEDASCAEAGLLV